MAGTDKFIESMRADIGRYQRMSVQHSGASEVLAKFVRILPAKHKARIEADKNLEGLQKAWDATLEKSEGNVLGAVRAMMNDMVFSVAQEVAAEANAQAHLAAENIGKAKEAARVVKQFEAMQTADEADPNASEDSEGDDVGSGERK